MRLLPSRSGSAVYVLVLTIASLIPVGAYWTTEAPVTVSAHSMTPFTSYDALHQFILARSCYDFEGLGRATGGTAPQPSTSGLATTAGFSDSTSVNSIPSHSETNAQVAGVDELDTVKNDGTYLFTVSNNTVVILLAYPVVDARVLARVSVNGSIQGVFVEGNRLVVISERFSPYPLPYDRAPTPMAGASIAVYPFPSYRQTSSLWVFDVSDHHSPVLTTTLVVNGTLAGARLIGDYAYMVATQGIDCSEPILLPQNTVNGETKMILPADIYHSDIADNSQSFTTVVGIDISQPIPSPVSKTFLIGTSSNIYVSVDRIYLTQPIWGTDEETAIHRISIDGSRITYDTTGTVSGHVLNQFSMDEYNGFFRIATTNYGFGRVVAFTTQAIGTWQQQSNLFVLDSSMHIVGSLEGLSPGEAFYAARFIRDRAYLVTFQRIDPLFVIGLQDPYQPKVLGQLNITGVSDYLQPYDDTYLIGLGKSSIGLTWENAALFQGLKLSLFDVTDPNHPVDTSNFLAGDRGSDSPGLTDHRSVLFEKSLNLLVIPVSIARSQSGSTDPWSYSPVVWQGAYVFSITPENGIVFRGGITHFPAGQSPTDYRLFVSRALYIGNVLYTVSYGTVKMNSLSDLSELSSVSLA